MLLLKRLRAVQFNWLYVAGEILLIFLGITLSQVFADWREEQSNADRQHELLIILKRSVQSDLNKLENNIRMCKTTLKMHQYLLDHLQRSTMTTDSLSLAFSYIGSNPSFSADMTGYKTIEAVGLIAIQDHEMRARIIDYYQVAKHYESWGTNVAGFLTDSFGPYVLTHFSDYNFMEKGIPFDLVAIKNDRVFLNVIKKANRLTYVTLEGMESHKKTAADFLAALPQE